MEQPKFTAIHGDCVEEVAKLPDNSIDFSIFSPPFAELYVYSDDIRDMGNCQDYEEFFVHFQFLVKELARVIKSGRLVAVHCMDLPAMKGKETTPKQKKKHSTPQRRTQKPQAVEPQRRHPSTKKGRANTARPLSSHHKRTLNKDNPSTPQPCRRNISQPPTFHMEQTTGIITTRTIPSPQTPQGYAPPRGGAPAGSLHLGPRVQI